MNNTARKLDTIKVNANLKNQAETIFNEIGMTPSEAINIFLAQVIDKGTFPFKTKTKKNKPPYLTEAFIDAKLKEAEDEIRKGAKFLDGLQAFEEIEKELEVNYAN
jgi:addiction module RelB/DinJ family antitoxin